MVTESDETYAESEDDSLADEAVVEDEVGVEDDDEPQGATQDKDSPSGDEDTDSLIEHLRATGREDLIEEAQNRGLRRAAFDRKRGEESAAFKSRMTALEQREAELAARARLFEQASRAQSKEQPPAPKEEPTTAKGRVEQFIEQQIEKGIAARLDKLSETLDARFGGLEKDLGLEGIRRNRKLSGAFDELLEEQPELGKTEVTQQLANLVTTDPTYRNLDPQAAIRLAVKDLAQKQEIARLQKMASGRRANARTPKRGGGPTRAKSTESRSIYQVIDDELKEQGVDPNGLEF